MKTEIIPYFGFDKIKFGLTLGQTELLLGKSSENNKESYSDDSSNVVLKYHNLGFNLTFSSDNDFRLGTITFYSKDFSIKGKKLIGLKETEFVMRSNLIFSDLQLDDDFIELNSKDYTSNSNGISFWINNGIVESISIFPNYQNDNETPIWPN